MHTVLTLVGSPVSWIRILLNFLVDCIHKQKVFATKGFKADGATKAYKSHLPSPMA